jgi:hypothetical protein
MFTAFGTMLRLSMTTLPRCGRRPLVAAWAARLCAVHRDRLRGSDRAERAQRSGGVRRNLRGERIAVTDDSDPYGWATFALALALSVPSVAR